ncbi:MAG: hypothetical protein QM278_12445 [Pseudomonadota bacterium]|nr:hypothetical protein [Pseudomonadota bacterium]
MEALRLPHLCQPDGGKSCGACCGLYNYADSSRESLTRRLRRRVALMSGVERTTAGLEEFARIVRETEDMTKRYEVIHCCEYLGFLDAEERRVGCLLHPQQNDGADYREASFYGRELCDGHFCPSYHYLSREEKHALIEVIDDWYLYGLVVTDIDLVKGYFRLIAAGIHETPNPKRLRGGPLHESVRSFFNLKLTWPFRDADANRLGKYYFDGAQYMIKYIDYEALGMEKSSFDQIFMSLSSNFSCREDVRAAEEIISRHVGEFVDIYKNFE